MANAFKHGPRSRKSWKCWSTLQPSACSPSSKDCLYCRKSGGSAGARVNESTIGLGDGRRTAASGVESLRRSAREASTSSAPIFRRMTIPRSPRPEGQRRPVETSAFYRAIFRARARRRALRRPRRGASASVSREQRGTADPPARRTSWSCSKRSSIGSWPRTLRGTFFLTQAVAGDARGAGQPGRSIISTHVGGRARGQSDVRCVLHDEGGPFNDGQAVRVAPR